MSIPSNIKIILADDHAIVREGISAMLRQNSRLHIVKECEDGEQLIENYFNYKPDIIITDISMPNISGIDALHKIRSNDPQAKALFLSMYGGEDYIYMCLKAGAKGLVNKNIHIGELTFAIEEIIYGRRYFGPGWDEIKLEELVRKYKSQLKNYDKDSLLGLTLKEKEIVLLISEGKTSEEIARTLEISKRTVDHHRSAVMQKMNLKSLTSLIKFSIQFAKEYESRN